MKLIVFSAFFALLVCANLVQSFFLLVRDEDVDAIQKDAFNLKPEPGLKVVNYLNHVYAFKI